MEPLAPPLELKIAEPDPVPVKEKQPATNTNKWVRPLVFLTSLVLLLITIVYPISAAAVNSWWASSSLQNAASALEAEKIQTAKAEALEAQNSFEGAASSLQDISWLSKIVGLSERSANLDHLLQAGANLSEAVENAASASQLLIETASNDNLNSDQAVTALNKVISNLYTSKDKLQQTQLLLSIIDWNKLPPSIVPTKNFVVTQTSKLQQEVNKLTSQIENLL